MIRITGMFLICMLGAFSSISAGELSVKEISDKKGGWSAENEFYRIGFTRNGSINELYFQGSGKGIKSIYLSHDCIYKFRLYNSENSNWGHKTTGEIKKISDAETTLILRFAFSGNGYGANAVYTYTFHADKPIVKLNIKLANDQKGQLAASVNDFLFLNSYFTNWAVGEPFKIDEIRTNKDAIPTDWKGGYNWTELFNFEDAFGIITIGTKPRSVIYCYNPQKYYIKGASVKLTNKSEKSVEQYIYIGPSNGGKALQEWARRLKKALP